MTIDDANQEQAKTRWIRPEDWTPEMKAAVEEMTEATLKRFPFLNLAEVDEEQS